MTFTALLHMWALSLAKCFDVLLCVNNLRPCSRHIYLHCQHRMCRQELLVSYLQDGGGEGGYRSVAAFQKDPTY